jgi:chemotaxis receptor (MCP) glutamine deamidase CheD
MPDSKKRLQEVDATIERLVAHLMEMYQERSDLRAKISHGSSDLSVQEM